MTEQGNPFGRKGAMRQRIRSILGGTHDEFLDRSLKEIGLELRRELTAERVLETSVDEVRRCLKADAVAIWLTTGTATPQLAIASPTRSANGAPSMSGPIRDAASRRKTGPYKF